MVATPYLLKEKCWLSCDPWNGIVTKKCRHPIFVLGNPLALGHFHFVSKLGIRPFSFLFVLSLFVSFFLFLFLYILFLFYFYFYFLFIYFALMFGSQSTRIRSIFLGFFAFGSRTLSPTPSKPTAKPNLFSFKSNPLTHYQTQNLLSPQYKLQKPCKRPILSRLLLSF